MSLVKIVTSKYLIDALNVIDSDDIIIGFSEGIDKTSNIAAPMIIKKKKGDDYIHILMPVSA